ncbi:hypothetical protein K7432_003366 [Basidiobolus ranarum]|uniref:Uncharacterized protein n=1 Tax=Basidiobolus ranarum TaxID=34480 RepID=A0ABR2X007_9FUNG
MSITETKRYSTTQSDLVSESAKITVIVKDVSRIKTITLRVPQGTTIRKVAELCCEKFEYWEEWNYAIYCDWLNSWLNDDLSIETYPPEARKSLLILSKKPDYFELASEKSSILFRSSEETIRYNPPKSNSFSSFFNRPYTSLKTKFRNDSLYLSVLIFRSDHKVLQTGSGLLPTLLVADNLSSMDGGKDFSESSEEFSWILKSSMEWETTNTSECYNPIIHHQARNQSYSPSLRLSFCEAADSMMKILPIPKLGHLHEHLIELSEYSSKMLLAVQYVSDKHLSTIATDLLKKGTLKWRSIESLSSRAYNSSYSVLSQAWTLYASRTVRPSPGLYVGLYHLEATATGVNILLHRHRKHMLPMVKIREDPELSEKEWKLITETKRGFSDESLNDEVYFNLQACKKDSRLDSFKYQFVKAFLKLQNLSRLKLSMTNIYDVETVDLKVLRRDDCGNVIDTVRIILIVNPIRLLQDSNALRNYAHHPRLAMYSFGHFETLHSHIYNPMYLSYRRKMLVYQTYLHEVKRGNLSCLPYLKLEDKNVNSLTKEQIITLVHEKIHLLKSKWPSISWSVRVLDWDRLRHWEKLGGSHKVYTGSQSRVLRSNSAHQIQLNDTNSTHFIPSFFDEDLSMFSNNLMRV